MRRPRTQLEGRLPGVERRKAVLQQSIAELFGGVVQRGICGAPARELGRHCAHCVQVFLEQQLGYEPHLAVEAASARHPARTLQFLARPFAERQGAKARLGQRDEFLGQCLQRLVLALARGLARAFAIL
jgi:hypothetical protein